MPTWVMELLPSDWLMFTFFALLLFFVLDYGIFTPWWKAPVSVFVFEYGLSVLMLMGLIIYGVVAGQRIDEWARVLVMFSLVAGITGKIIVLKVSRREGRIERRRLREAAAAEFNPTERKIMSTPPVEAVKSATQIWYKAQRVLRTTFTTLLTLLPLVPQVVQIVQGQWDAAWLSGVAVQAVAINAVLTGIIALPTVNAWLTKIGLGSVPKSAIVQTPRGTVVKTDPTITKGA